jgi:uncharacterized membrane protein (UPF0182 family)
VIRGNVPAIPIEETLLNVEPVYLQAETAAYPDLRLVGVMHDDKLSYGNTFEEALGGLFIESDPRTAVESKPAGIGEASIEFLIRRANDAFGNYLEHLGRRQFDEASGSLKDLQQTLEEMAKMAETDTMKRN